MFVIFLIAAFGIFAGSAARADEGMWTYNNFPTDLLDKRYGFRPNQEWLDHLRLSSVRLARGCSGAFVSPKGLVQTNHHCAAQCVEHLSAKGNDLLRLGFLAKEEKDEIKCPNVEANQLIDISDVTQRVKETLAGKEGAEYAEARKAAFAAIARDCSGGNDAIRCDVVDLYHGGIYNLYKYRRYQDVRLVFAPEKAIAFFGGDPDNFEFPRYDLDVSFLRVYEDGKPLDSFKNFLRYAKTDIAPGDLTFTSGNPGATRRLSTVAELKALRDITLPREIWSASELRGMLTEFATKGEEEARIAAGHIFGIENSLKAQKGKFEALVTPGFMEARQEAENTFRAKVDADPELKSSYGGAWDGISATLEAWRPKRERYNYLEGGKGFNSRLFGQALSLVRAPVELAKPDEKRFPEYTAANFPFLKQAITAKVPIYPELERLTLAFSLTKLREALGPDDPFVKKVLGNKSPAQLAADLVDRTRLGDAAYRTQLLEGGQAAIDAANDPMIELARLVDPDFRAIRKDFEDNFAAPITKFTSQIADARFKIFGTSTYPDATFTLRLSFGTVKGYWQNGKYIEPITTIGGLYDRATGAEPYALPQSWIEAKPALDMRQPLNFATDNDIIGGNSGSPVVNKAGEVVGLIFDGNIQSLGGDFGFSDAQNRAVAVSVGAIREALAKVYHAERLAAELAQ